MGKSAQKQNYLAIQRSDAATQVVISSAQMVIEGLALSSE